MPQYYDYKIRICSEGAISNAQRVIKTIEELDKYIDPVVESNGGDVPPKINAVFASAVEKIDAAENSLNEAMLELATLFPGHPGS